MDPLSISPLVISIWKIISPFAKKIGGKLIDKASEKIPDAVGKMWELIRDKMEKRPESQNIPKDLVSSPEDQAVQGAFQYQLKKILENDEALARQLDALVKEAKQSANYSAFFEGNGANAQGSHTTAVGQGGVYIGGDASGNSIITGDNNTINEKK